MALWVVPATAQERKFVIGGGLGIGSVGMSVSSGGAAESIGNATALATDFRIGYQALPELAFTYTVRALIDGTGATNVWGLGTDFAPAPNTLVRTVVGRASILAYDDPVSFHGLGLSIGVEQRIVGPVYGGRRLLLRTLLRPPRRQSQYPQRGSGDTVRSPIES